MGAPAFVVATLALQGSQPKAEEPAAVSCKDGDSAITCQATCDSEA